MNPLDELEEYYPQIIAEMDDKFDSHEFILKLANRHQAEYVRALGQYPDSNQPFQIVHGQLAKRLRRFEDSVEWVGEDTSPDIFGNMTNAAQWRKKG